MIDRAEIPRWGAAFLAELPATTERVAEFLGLEDDEAQAGLVHLAATNWAVAVAGRGSRVWYPIGPDVGADTERRASVRVLAVLPGTVSQLRVVLADLTGRRISGALNDHRRAGRVAQDGEVWQVVPADESPGR